jgi:hypothetical protein
MPKELPIIAAFILAPQAYYPHPTPNKDLLDASPFDERVWYRLLDNIGPVVIVPSENQLKKTSFRPKTQARKSHS